MGRLQLKMIREQNILQSEEPTPRNEHNNKNKMKTFYKRYAKILSYNNNSVPAS